MFTPLYLHMTLVLFTKELTPKAVFTAITRDIYAVQGLRRWGFCCCANHRLILEGVALFESPARNRVIIRCNFYLSHTQLIGQRYSGRSEHKSWSKFVQYLSRYTCVKVQHVYAYVNEYEYVYVGVAGYKYSPCLHSGWYSTISFNY